MSRLEREELAEQIEWSLACGADPAAMAEELVGIHGDDAFSIFRSVALPQFVQVMSDLRRAREELALQAAYDDAEAYQSIRG